MDKIEFKDKLVSINRITKVVKGGRRFAFSALVVVGNSAGSIGVGHAKAKQVPDAIKKATENVFKNKKIPFRSFEVFNRNEQTLGEIFCFFILETILLGRALKVNPFDQPSVELIKRETKKILLRN